MTDYVSKIAAMQAAYRERKQAYMQNRAALGDEVFCLCREAKQARAIAGPRLESDSGLFEKSTVE